MTRPGPQSSKQRGGTPLPFGPATCVFPECPAPDGQGLLGKVPGQDLPPRPLTWARLPRPCGDSVGTISQDVDSLLHHPQAGPAHPRQKRLCT